jgi:hypothetical protein
MARKRKDDEDEVSKLEKEIRELKSINRSLLRRLRKIDKGFHEFVKESVDEKEEERQPEPAPVPRKQLCGSCGRSELTEVTIAGRQFKRCEVCGWRSKAEKK